VAELVEPYRGVEDALRFAFAIEGATGARGMEVGVCIRATNPSELSFHERVAEGAYVRRQALRVAGCRGRDSLRVWYGRVSDPHLAGLKVRAITRLAQHLQAETKRDPELMEDAVRRWCGMALTRSFWRWAQDLSVSKRTISRWCCSQNPADRSAAWFLSSWYQLALARVEAEFQEKSLVP